jgi:hypothetical protein
LDFIDVKPGYETTIISTNQSLSMLTSKAIDAVNNSIQEILKNLILLMLLREATQHQLWFRQWLLIK